MEIQRTQEAIEDAKWSQERSERLRADRQRARTVEGLAPIAMHPDHGREVRRAANKRARASRRQNRRR